MTINRLFGINRVFGGKSRFFLTLNLWILVGKNFENGIIFVFFKCFFYGKCNAYFRLLFWKKDLLQLQIYLTYLVTYFK